jgi:hypothetical protein
MVVSFCFEFVLKLHSLISEIASKLFLRSVQLGHMNACRSLPAEAENQNVRRVRAQSFAGYERPAKYIVVGSHSPCSIMLIAMMAA